LKCSSSHSRSRTIPRQRHHQFSSQQTNLQPSSSSYGPPYPSQFSGYGSSGSGSGSGNGSSGNNSNSGDVALYALLARRAILAMGMAYAWTEYVVDMTLCEGPSMTPTIHPYGEIVVMDRWNPRQFGLKDGDDGSARARLARDRQGRFEKEQLEKVKHKRTNRKSNTSHDNDLMFCWHEPVLGSVSDRMDAITYPAMWRHIRSPISVGDVLVVQHPRRKGTVCKRVVGLPGDQILLGSGASASLSQLSNLYRPPAGRGGGRGSSQLLVVPDGHVWLEGDNPANSSDSRHYGPVPASLIVGRVLCRAWPIRGHAWMVRGKRPEDPHGYVSAAATVVLPAGYDGQPILKKIAHDAAAAAASGSS
jgi:signal peptidase I